MKTKCLKPTTDDELTAAIDQARNVLNAGGLVAFPTETVYGLAAAAHLPAAIDRLAQLKQRPDDKPFTLHIPDQTELQRYVPGLSPINTRFLQKAWPGPVTVIFTLSPAQRLAVTANLPCDQIDQLYHNHSIGIRLPDNNVARRLLAAIPAPVVAPSANLAGAPPATAPADVLDQLDGQIDLLLDAGPTRYAKPSTIVKLDQHDLDIIRVGVLDAPTIGRMRAICILFVCTGNTCRSPMAQAICRHRLAQQLSCSVDQLPDRGYNIISAGVMACPGANASPEAQSACRELRVDIADHRAQPLTVDLIHRADFVFAMTESHRQAIVDLAPQAAARTTLLAQHGNIDDPIGMGMDQYRICAQVTDQSIRRRLAEMFTDAL